MTTLADRIRRLSPAKRALLALRTSSRPSGEAVSTERAPIAITGIGVRMPSGVRSPQALWELLRGGGDTVADIPASRWDREAFYSADPDAPGKMYTRQGSFLADVDQFDAQFFGIAPREAQSLDPQQRLLLEACWEALEHAGQAPAALNGSRTGVFVALGSSGYADLVSAAQGGVLRVDTFAGTGNGSSFAAGRLSYVLGLHGPCVAIDTACSSSLVAVHLACQSLHSGESTLALAGGVNLILGPEGNVLLSRMRALSPDGRCKAFDASADGYGRGEGCGIVVLRRLSDALADDAPVLAVIRGSAVNHDGRSGGLTVPSGTAQRALLRKALADARVDPGAISYIEAHGTGTPLGDPIEVSAIADVYGAGRPAEAPLRLGSIKANIAHLESAAGIAGLIKVALALHHEEIPPQIHFERWNPELPRDTAPLDILTAPAPWPRAARPRLAGVSAFGMSGTNAHLIVEEAPLARPKRPERNRPLDLLCLSAKSAPALRDAADRWATHLEAATDVSIGDVCHTSRVGRTHFMHRLAVTTGSVTDASQALRAFVATGHATQIAQGIVSRSKPPRVAFLFSGQGAQYADMGRELFATEPVFRSALEECEARLRPHLPLPLLSVMHASPDEPARLDDTRYTQPAMVALGYALARLWQSWGVEPAAVMGHSVGEYAAACIAGVLDLEDALRLVATRARLMDALPRTGAMVAVLGDPAAVIARLSTAGPMVSLAAINGPANVVISGERTAVDAFVEQLEADGIDTRPLRTSHAFHSALLDPMLDELEQAAQTTACRLPNVPLISNLTGQPLTSVPDADYFRRQAREPVQFAAGIGALAAAGCDAFIEMGPHTTLVDMGQRCLHGTQAAWLPSLERGKTDTQVLLGSAAALYARGVTLDWAAFDRGHDRRRVALPVYPFRHTRHWVEAPAAGAVSPPIADRLSARPVPRTQLSNLFVDVVE
jgi:acyl transferase domain-containing protein